MTALKESSEKDISVKQIALKTAIRSLGSVAVCFSGGTDSAFLLATAFDVLGDRAIAITCTDASVPQRELHDAISFCRERGIRHFICPVNPLEEEGYRRNSPERCYYCKRGIFTAAKKIADENGIAHIAEGSNVDDLGDYRPGLRAVAEMSVKSPLREANLHKAEIRLLSKAAGLPTWNKPAYACLASRFVYGDEITEKKLQMIDAAEQFLIDLGFRAERVRLHGNVARIEVPSEDISRLASSAVRTKVFERFKKIGFLYVTLDLEGYRTGSMNAALPNK
ncbi:MAG: ATP-dependent sacrificial sulfur transferase LarE [Clostridia bacterium]|nr:ATP-dependent sacrificial sulfur transferase LarE [Clostridia bacterium]